MKINRNFSRYLIVGLLSAVVWPAWISPAKADSPGDQTVELQAAKAAADIDKFNAADNAWVLTSSALVLMMTAPGLALFYCGLVRRKNALSVMMQCVFLMCLMTLLWALYGYSLVFGGTGPWIGDLRYLFMRGVDATWSENGPRLALAPGLTIPVMTHMLFQGMFFIITPALICGAFAERMKFSTMIVFMILWGTFIYCPLAHWLWGGGILAYGSQHAKEFSAGGALDFAGGTVVHISSGVSALICALLLGKRLGYGTEPIPPHNMTYTAVGAAMLWVGWFGFNAGSALCAGRLATCAFAATHFAAAAGGLTWTALEWIYRGKPSVLGCCSGLVAGLACVTQAAGYVTLMPALVIGAAGGAACYTACTMVKARFGYDDSLDVFGVHGIAGTMGAILTGIFAVRATGAVEGGQLLGLIEGGSVLKAQIIAVAAGWGLAVVGTFVILKVLDAVMGLRVSQASEIEGLDLSQQNEEGYIFI
ncbi:MAG: ammonium transporter [Thermoguttaceae bacterium]